MTIILIINQKLNCELNSYVSTILESDEVTYNKK